MAPGTRSAVAVVGDEEINRLRIRQPRTDTERVSPRGLFAQAKRFYKLGRDAEDYRNGIVLLKRAASLGLADAHEWLGAVYDYGLGTRPNRRRALEHYRIAADAGNPNAEYHVGVFFHEGIAVQRDYRVAVSWLRKAAKHGDQVAVYWLGQCYLHGRGVLVHRHGGPADRDERRWTGGRACGAGRIPVSDVASRRNRVDSNDRSWRRRARAPGGRIGLGRRRRRRVVLLEFRSA